MSGRRLRTALALVLAVAVAATVDLGVAAGGESSTATASRSHCRPAGKVLAAGEIAILWRREFSTYACVHKSGRVIRLGTNDGGGISGQYRYRLAGRYVAYDEAFCNSMGQCGGLIFVKDLLRRRTVREIDGSPDEGRATDLLLTRRGSVAWIRTGADGKGNVSKFDSGGRALLDSGADPGSLARAGSTLYWTKDGSAQFAPID